MFILINGSFGIGKTSAAELLVRQVAGASLYDPERVGFVLRRLPAWMWGSGEKPSDYQDMAIWRRLIANGARRRHRRSDVVVVPMAFTNLAYLDAFACGLATEAAVHRLCLVAPLPVVRARLEQRVKAERRGLNEFELRRSRECVEAHQRPEFGIPIDATAPLEQVVNSIRAATGLSNA